MYMHKLPHSPFIYHNWKCIHCTRKPSYQKLAFNLFNLYLCAVFSPKFKLYPVILEHFDAKIIAVGGFAAEESFQRWQRPVPSKQIRWWPYCMPPWLRRGVKLYTNLCFEGRQ